MFYIDLVFYFVGLLLTFQRTNALIYGKRFSLVKPFNICASNFNVHYTAQNVQKIQKISNGASRFVNQSILIMLH